MNISISVCICCYNSALRLPKTLAFLAAQQTEKWLLWEVIVIDNASTDNTGEVALHCWPEEMIAPLRVIREPRAGLIFARQRAFAESVHEIICFVDDDNWICEDWLQQVGRIMLENPTVAICGGRSVAEFEIEPPLWLGDLVRTLAVGKQSNFEGDVTESHGWLWGAGMSVRRRAWEELAVGGYSNLLTGRAGKGLSAGEDAELSLAFRMAGWRVYYTNSLVFSHYIPAARLTWDYFKRLNRGFGASVVILEIYDYYLEPAHADGRKNFRSSWTFKFVARIRRAAVLAAKLVWPALLSRKEGDENELRLQLCLGYLQRLLHERKRHADLHREIGSLAKKLRECNPRKTSRCNKPGAS